MSRATAKTSTSSTTSPASARKPRRVASAEGGRHIITAGANARTTPEAALFQAGKVAGRLWASLTRLLAPTAAAADDATPSDAGSPRSRVRRKLRAESLHSLAEALFRHVALPDFERTGTSVRATVAATTSHSGKVRLDPLARTTAFLLGAVFDRMIDADKAWAAPLHLADRLGHLDLRRIARADPQELERLIRGRRKGEALHRLPGAMARNIVNIATVIVRDYGADPEGLWPDGTPVPVLLARLKALPGIGDKLANMVVVLLVRDYGKHFPDASKTDIAVDRHVARVFLRAGLVGDPADQSPRVGALKQDVIERARGLYPAYPGGLDLPTFFIGKEFCRSLGNGGPRCGECPLRDACPQDRRKWDVR